jgi:hypothetical protein
MASCKGHMKLMFEDCISTIAFDRFGRPNKQIISFLLCPGLVISGTMITFVNMLFLVHWVRSRYMPVEAAVYVEQTHCMRDNMSWYVSIGPTLSFTIGYTYKRRKCVNLKCLLAAGMPFLFFSIVASITLLIKIFMIRHLQLIVKSFLHVAIRKFIYTELNYLNLL